MIRILLILTLIPSILFSQFTVTTSTESWLNKMDGIKVNINKILIIV